MTVWVFVLALLLIVAVNIFLWKSGFLMQAEHPEIVADRPIQDEKERKAFLKRLRRWKEEGKISRQEYEHLQLLCRKEWDREES